MVNDSFFTTENTPILRVDESLNFLASSSSIDTAFDSKFTFYKEIPSFSNKEHFSFVPHLQFVHNLYLYPMTANLSGTSGRNIAIQVSILDTDDPQASPLPVMCGGVWVLSV
jgi:hypothetical protein